VKNDLRVVVLFVKKEGKQNTRAELRFHDGVLALVGGDLQAMRRLPFLVQTGTTPC
jgi:hypothetical protein